MGHRKKFYHYLVDTLKKYMKNLLPDPLFSSSWTKCGTTWGHVYPAPWCQNGISDATFYKWRAKFGGMDISDAKRLRQLEEENSRLKKMVAEQALDISILKDVLSKNF